MIHRQRVVAIALSAGPLLLAQCWALAAVEVAIGSPDGHLLMVGDGRVRRLLAQSAIHRDASLSGLQPALFATMGKCELQTSDLSADKIHMIWLSHLCNAHTSVYVPPGLLLVIGALASCLWFKLRSKSELDASARCGAVQAD